eukprot:7692021-Karenia_brevis.AAC.1
MQWWKGVPELRASKVWHKIWCLKGLSNVIRLGTDSSAAKTFVCRRGLRKMRHLEISDLWLQKEVGDG